jgi:2-polyprenyl-3-methyl-5-hydroxy-6-metoxy-1,4-benzoquinol methylase
MTLPDRRPDRRPAGDLVRRPPESEKMYFYESFAEAFDSAMNAYDTNKRVRLVFDDLLPENLEGKTLLDAGCGTGWFSRAACERKSLVTSMDLGERLLAKVKDKCRSARVIGSILQIPFRDNTFDYVVSSEVIEHTPAPYAALHELHRVLKPGGKLVLSTPNRLWYWSLLIANRLRLRPYQGLENWSGYFQLKREARKAGFRIERMCGVHLLPFVHPATYPINDCFHAFRGVLGPLMVNIVIKASKDGRASVA